MNWTNFKDYLEQKILQKKEELEEEEENDEDNKSEYTLRPAAKTKYSVSKEPELILTLTNLIISIDNNEELNYHSLPPLTDLLSEDNKLKTWTEYFPERSTTHFGQKQEIEVEITSQTWTILGKIFNDYVQTATRKERLEDFASEDEMMMEVLFKGLARLNASALKKQGYDTKLRNWLAEYEKLEDGEKTKLEKQKKQIAAMLAVLEESSKPEQQEQKSWYQSIPWTKVLWYGGGGLLVILVIGWLRSKFKK